MNVQRAMREKDAKNATCWRSIGPIGGSNGTNRPCLASGCMAWVLIDQIGIGPQGQIRTNDLDGRTSWEWRGRCGLVEPGRTN
jgi:hypothetical protein